MRDSEEAQGLRYKRSEYRRQQWRDKGKRSTGGKPKTETPRHPIQLKYYSQSSDSHLSKTQIILFILLIIIAAMIPLLPLMSSSVGIESRDAIFYAIMAAVLSVVLGILLLLTYIWAE